MNKKVLLTGISGYIGLHCAKILLEKGYTVVGTVRSTNKEEEVIKTLNSNSVSVIFCKSVFSKNSLIGIFPLMVIIKTPNK